LFAAGAGLDVAGGFLLARGLIVGSDEILRRTITGETFFSAPETASKISDKVDASLGLSTLIVGFAVQAAAYAVVAGGDQQRAWQRGGSSRRHWHGGRGSGQRDGRLAVCQVAACEEGDHCDRN
jgi:hypothetical protein